MGDDTINALAKSGKIPLFNKLAREFEDGLGDVARDQVQQEWKMYPVPIYNNNHFQVFDLYVRANHQNASGNAASDYAPPSYKRFVIDLQMSRLGYLQLDGLVQSKKIDILVRSEKILPHGLHHALRETYRRTLEGVNFSGSLGFEVGRQNWLILRKQTARTAVIA